MSEKLNYLQKLRKEYKRKQQEKMYGFTQQQKMYIDDFFFPLFERVGELELALEELTNRKFNAPPASRSVIRHLTEIQQWYKNYTDNHLLHSLERHAKLLGCTPHALGRFLRAEGWQRFEVRPSVWDVYGNSLGQRKVSFWTKHPLRKDGKDTDAVLHSLFRRERVDGVMKWVEDLTRDCPMSAVVEGEGTIADGGEGAEG